MRPFRRRPLLLIAGAVLAVAVALLVSDDHAGAVYRISFEGE